MTPLEPPRFCHACTDHVDSSHGQALEAAMEASGRSLRRLTSQLFRQTLRGPAAAACVRRAELGPLLAYAISDAPRGDAEPWSGAFAAELDGLPLLRLANEHQQYDSAPGCESGKDGIAVLRTAQGHCGRGGLWLCHKLENRDFPALLGHLTTVYTLDTAAADFLDSVERLIAKVPCNVKVMAMPSPTTPLRAIECG